MNFASQELSMSLLALTCLPLFFLAPGYVAASALNLFNFRAQGWIERLLWAAALSLPLALILCVHPGLSLSPRHTTMVVIALSPIALVLALRDWLRETSHRVQWDREASVALAAAVLLVVYCILAASPVQWHGGLYESAIWQDWGVRIQLVNASIRGGNHPGNPMFAPDGRPAPLHYYYFWYILCARMRDVVPVSARALLSASCVGAAMSLEAFLFLSVKYLGSKSAGLRQQCIATLLAACILGLDLLPTLAALPFHRLYPDLQFWLQDRSPSWLHTLLWSPHHIAGVVCCGLATLLLVSSVDVTPAQRLAHGTLAGLCFAAAIGTSSFIALLFASACAWLLVDAVKGRRWSFLQATAIATVVALLASGPFLRATLLAPNVGSGTSQHLLVPRMRYAPQAFNLAWVLLREGYKVLFGHPAAVVPTRGLFWLHRAVRLPIAACLFLLDFGFFAFVLFWQMQRDFRSPEHMSRQARTLWLIFGGIAVPGCLLNSGELQNNNDFGRHASLCMHFVLLLWAAPLVANFLQARRRARDRHKPVRVSTARWVALGCAWIGLAGQVAQVVLDRIHMPLASLNLIPQAVVSERVPRLAFRFEQIQQAMAASAMLVPNFGIVQSDPHSRLQPLFLLYTSRQMAASDDGCNTPFGGSPQRCTPIARELIELFGGSGPHFHGNSNIFKPRIGFDPSRVTPANLAFVCSSLHLDVVAASYADPVWWYPNSWVWQLKPAFANSTVRVIPCPLSGHGPQHASVDPT